MTTSTFAKRFSTAVDGKVYAQPLYVPSVTVVGGANAGTHNLVFVATQHDSLYAIDADSGVIVWHTSFTTTGLAGASSITSMPSADSNTTDTSPEIGVCGTPVIDTSSHMLYVAAKTKQIVSGASHYVYTFYKIDITNGDATTNANIVASTIVGDTVYNSSSGAYTYHTASSATAAQDIFVPGTGDGSITVNGQSRVYFNVMRQMNRPGLLLYGGKVYLAFGSHGDNGPYHGWLLAYDENTLALEGVLNTTPNGGLGGFWTCGAAPAVDSNGYIYIMSGNGTFDGSGSNGTTTGLNSSGFPAKGNYGDSVLKITNDSTTSVGSQGVNGWGLKIVDYFSPFNNQSLNSADTDLGSGGITLLPDSAGSSAHPHLMVGAGKQGNIYLIDRDSLGKFSSSTDNVVQSQTAIGECFSTSTFFNGVLYCVGVQDNLKAFPISNAKMSTTPTKSTDTFAWPGATTSLSANGTSNAILWAVEYSTGQLRAYNPTNVATEWWTSALAANSRDALGSPEKFAAPTIADGHVFVGTTTALVEYGLTTIVSTSPPAAPTNLLATAVSALQINLSWTDNSTNENGFAIEQSLDNVHFTQIGTVGVNVTTYSAESGLSSGTTYYYRVRAFNGTSNQTYSVYTNVASATTSGTAPAINFSSGFANSATSLVYNGSAKIVSSRAQLTDGGADEAGTVFTASKEGITQFSTQFTFQMTTAKADGVSFIIQNDANTALGGDGGALGFGGLAHSVAIKFDIYSNAGEGTDSTGIFVNGANPYTPATDLSASGIVLRSGDVMSVSLNYNGTTLTEIITDTVTGATQTVSYTINIPITIGASTAYVGFGGGTGWSTVVSSVLTWSFSPLAESVPAAPSALTATAVSGTQINLSWTDNSSNENGFIVMRATNGGAYAQTGVTGAGVATYSDSALAPNTTYSYKVEATNNAGNSAFSNVASALTPIPPATPTNAHPTTITSSSIAMAWTDNATNETGYKILRKMTTASNFAQIASLPANTTSYTDSGLSAGTSYDYHIQAYNVAGYSDFSGFTAVTSAAAAVAANVPAVFLGATGAEVDAGVSPGGKATSVYIQYGTTSSYGSQTPLKNIGAGLKAVPVLELLPGLTPSTIYHYRIVTVTASGVSYGSDQELKTLPFETTVVATSGDAAPGTSGAKFATFGSPAINASGHCAFRGTLALGTGVAAANDSGIWADDSNGDSQLVARTGVTTAPGAGPSVFRTLSDPVYNSHNSVAFIGSLSVVAGGATRTSDVAVFSTSSGTLSMVARQGTQAPDLPAGVTFAGFSEIALPDVNGVVFLGTLNLNASAGVSISSDTGIWAVDGSNNLHLIIRTGQVLGGKTVETLSLFSPLAPVSGQSRNISQEIGAVTFLVTFTDRSTALYDAISASTITPVIATGSGAPGSGAATFLSFGSPAINASGHNAFRATLQVAGGVTAATDEGLWADNVSGALQLVTRTGAIAPGATTAFATLSDPVYNNENGCAFVGTLRPGAGLEAKTTTGIWSTIGGDLEPIALGGAQAPGCPVGATFAKFEQIALPDVNGGIFLATLNLNAAAGVTYANDLGIWATDNSGQLQLVVRTGDVLNGKTITALTFLPLETSVGGQSRNFSPSTGDLVYNATFSDGTQTIVNVAFP